MCFTKKTTIGITAGIILVMLGVNALSDKNTETKIATFSNPEVIFMDSRKMVYQPMLIAPYKTMDVFISNEQKSDFEFTSVGLSWEETTPEGGNVEAEMKFKVKGEWTGWIELEEEEDPLYENSEVIKKYAMASINPAQAFQYKFTMYGDGKNSPIIKNTDWTLIKAGETVSTKPEPKPKYFSYTPLSDATYLALSAGTSGIITRAQWGANESYRYMGNNGAEPQLIELPDDFYIKYADELRVSRTVEEDENGGKYKWPLKYPEKVSKIIIHHTATSKDLNNPAQAIRDIYYYHAVSRRWGDIGYNYIIDQDGKIYEGRYGGEGVVGAHSGPGNHGSIGIAILGNYQDNSVPEKAIGALSQFIYKKAKIHGIDTDGFSNFRGELMANIIGHRDIMSTTCPGDYLYEKLPIIRSLSAQNFTQKKKFEKDYDYQNISDLYYIELKPEETVDVTLKMENIGKVDWNDETFVVVDQNPDFDNVISFPGKNEAVLARMEEKLVRPGETAAFNFKIKAGRMGRTVYMKIVPVMNGSKKPTDYIILPIGVQQPIFKYELVDGELPPAMMKAETQFSGWVKLRNKGNVAWEKSGANEIVLRTNSSILGELEENRVNPGDTGTFKINMMAPSKAGYHYESFAPTMEGATWTSDDEMSFATTVYEREYDSEPVSRTPYVQWERGKNYTISIKLRNIGSQSWEQKYLRLAFLKERDLKISELTLSPKTVRIGEMGTINFTVNVDENESPGNKTMFIRSRIKNNPIMKIPISFGYKITEKQFQSPDTGEDEIRVKIGFSGDPEITANGTFEVRGGDNLMATTSAGKTVTVKKVNGKYRVEADGTFFTRDEPIRFVPKNSAILQVKNYEHRPSWNLSLNDNKYRGILEVRDVEGTLVVINELFLEDYLKGLGEVPDAEPIEKIKAILVAARSYAKYYMDIDEKFPGKPYHLDDDPNVSQKYLGYGFEDRAPNIVSAVDATKGKVIGYGGTVVKAPYFSQSDGVRTKSALDVWGWTNTPYLVSVDDSFCDGRAFYGHGVGLSGCGAKGMAEQGYSYEEILKHYYSGIEIMDL